MKLQPYCLGSGRSADAIQKALFVISQNRPDWNILPSIKVARDRPIPPMEKDDTKNVIFIANPLALHTPALIAAAKAGFDAAIIEKPAAVNLKQIADLGEITIPVGVLHGYRESWGVRTIRRMHKDAQLGELIAIEGRYWQSSAATRALDPIAPKASWKDDTSLSGEYDTLIDIGIHWVDSACFIAGALPQKGILALSHLNSGLARQLSRCKDRR
ncbi:MAG: hypothetical protein EOP09_17790 [Proteobacteria bacterium]|nr:MAG: hypothetical protein EOP09_17790 [Pseudomonadota bacterium]